MAIGTALAIGLGAAASAGGSVASGLIARSGANRQAEAAERSSSQAIAEQRRQFDLNRRDLMPWLNAGSQAVQMLQHLLGLGVPPGQATQAVSQATGVAPRELQSRFEQLLEIDGGRGMLLGMERGDGDVFQPSTISRDAGAPASGFDPSTFGSLSRDFSAEDFQADPGYAFRLKEGFKALERSAAARGTVLSGGTLRELARYNQNFASDEFGRAFDRFNINRSNRFNQLASLAGLGQQTATTLGSLGQRSAENIGNLTVGGQTAAAAARASGYNALGQGIAGAAQLPLNWYLLSQFSGGGGGAGYGNAGRG